MHNKLKQRAALNLANQNEITDELIGRCCEDANEIKGTHIVPYWVLEDFAYIRLKIYLKINLSEEDALLYENALKQIKNSPLEKNGEVINSRFKAKKRKGILV